VKLLPDKQPGQARSLATVTLENQIMKHNQHYIELNPERIPVKPEPSDTVIVLGALLACAAVYLLTIILFSL
jgi:hypothetical protein